MPTTTITTIRTVAIPAADQDRSLAFFVDKLGFEKQMDAELAEGFRWIEVAAPGSPVSVAIVAASEELPAGVDTGIRFVTTDAGAEHAFWVFGLPFLVLDYHIRPKGGSSAVAAA